MQIRFSARRPGRSVNVTAVVVLFSVTALGAFLRLHGSTNAIVFSDEAFSWRVAVRSWSELAACAAADVHPPGYFALLKVWMGIFGSSPLAMRSLSVVAGVAAIPMAFAVVRRAGHFTNSSRSAQQSWIWGGIAAAALVALQPLQVDASRLARMYSVGALLTGVTSWFLITAMLSVGQAFRSWIAYGLTAALFLYVHYFAMFTILAQILLAAVYLIRQASQQEWRRIPQSAFGPAVGIGLAIILFLPWAAAFYSQASQVREDYWIQLATPREARMLFIHWVGGIESADARVASVAVVALAGAAAWLIATRSVQGLMFLVLAVVPVLGAWIISTAGGRPIMQERYLTFAQFAMCLAWGSAVGSLRGRVLRALLCCVLLGIPAYGTMGYVRGLPSRPPAVAEAVDFLKSVDATRDLVVAPSLQAVNIMKYYAVQAKVPEMQVRYRGMSFPAAGHVTHLASLEFDDFLWPEWETRLPSRRIWVVDDAITPSRDWRQGRRMAFIGNGRYRRNSSLFSPTISEYVQDLTSGVRDLESTSAPGAER